jgi:radical SAM superfamily enzyme YgiQ (UPF0313 family)
MTYWYPGVEATVNMVKETYPRTPVILGGIYPTLQPDHARKLPGVDQVVSGQAEEEWPRWLESIIGIQGEEAQPTWMSYPALELKRGVQAVPILTSRGCPFGCRYCASRILFPGFKQRAATEVIAEISFWNQSLKVRDFVFYDDALLSNGADNLVAILKGAMELGIRPRFHSPNGINIRGMTRELAGWMKRANWKTLRLGLESAIPDFQKKLGDKVENREFELAVKDLHQAGFSPDEIGVYILAGLPGQGAGEVEESIKYIKQKGARPIIAEYSPVPGTDIWEEAVRASAYDISGEPLFQNNTLLPCQGEGFSSEDLRKLKQLIQKC